MASFEEQPHCLHVETTRCFMKASVVYRGLVLEEQPDQVSIPGSRAVEER